MSLLPSETMARCRCSKLLGRLRLIQARHSFLDCHMEHRHPHTELSHPRTVQVVYKFYNSMKAVSHLCLCLLRI